MTKERGRTKCQIEREIILLVKPKVRKASLVKGGGSKMLLVREIDISFVKVRYKKISWVKERKILLIKDKEKK